MPSMALNDTPAPADVTCPPCKSSLAGVGRDDLASALTAAGVPAKHVRMRLSQLWSWIYAHGATSWDSMSDVSKELRARLAEAYSLQRPEVVS